MPAHQADQITPLQIMIILTARRQQDNRQAGSTHGQLQAQAQSSSRQPLIAVNKLVHMHRQPCIGQRRETSATSIAAGRSYHTAGSCRVGTIWSVIAPERTSTHWQQLAWTIHHKPTLQSLCSQRAPSPRCTTIGLADCPRLGAPCFNVMLLDPDQMTHPVLRFLVGRLLLSGIQGLVFKLEVLF